MSTIKERLSRAEEKVSIAHKRLDDLEQKKLSKHEFNGHVHVLDNIKTMVVTQFAQHEKSIHENTLAITSLQTTFENAKGFLPTLISTIKWFGGIIILLLIFIGSNLMGLW